MKNCLRTLLRTVETMFTFQMCLRSLSIICVVIAQVSGIERTFYIGIQEENWDYAPTRKNLISGKDIAHDEYASVFLKRGPQRIGSVYKKAIYKQYTDASYSQEIPKPPWLGYLGPILRAEVHDIIIVHLKNFGSRHYSIHPHGVFYAKDSEGALYPDGTAGSLKNDDGVPPRGNYTYTWTVKRDYAPQKGDANCLTWAYHSHVSASQDISSGLIGALLTCKKGTLRTVSTSGHHQVQRTDVDQDLILMFSVVDENISWYLKENIQTFCSDPNSVDPASENFHESNMMHAINGYMYGNLPGIQFCQNRTVALHLFGMGNEVDIHSAYFHGHTLLDRGHRVDVMSLFSATFATAEMFPMTTGTWLLNCQVNDHLKAGMQALFNVTACREEMNSPALNGHIRQYFIAAEKVHWDYAPSGIDKLTNESLTKPGSFSEVFFGKGGGRLGGKYWKVVYREYKDKTFTSKRMRTSAETHLGLLGPVLRAEVGDTLQVMFMNKADRIYSIQPHGLQYDKPFEGVFYQDGIQRTGYKVQPGGTFTYSWQVREGPSESDPPCISYLYFSSSDPVRDTNAGLIGPLLVCKKGVLTSSGAQNEVDHEFFLLFSVFDENLSWYLKQNIETYDSDESDSENVDFQKSNKMHAVNGFMYGNLPGLEMEKGSRVRWHLMGLGSEMDMHGVYFQGNTFQRQGTTRDTLSLFPHTSVTVSMQPDVSGVFELSCLVSNHYVGGMKQLYRVTGSEDEKPSVLWSQIVEYFISAEEVEWDYSPNRTWELKNFNTTEDKSPGSLFVGKGKNRLGSMYKKVVYREYTDATFRTRKQRQTQDEHLEILGPIIRAEVGQVLLITFMNKASRPYSIQAHGVRTAASKPEAVMPGNVTQYRWTIPAKSGPGVSDPNCIAFVYRSAVDFVKDTASGLIGPLVICRRGVLNQARQRTDVDKEFALLFMVFDENKSWYLEENIQSYSSEPPLRDEEFQKSNKMYGINGKLYGNLHGLEMVEGERAVWYLFGMGNEADIHTVHFHAETFTYKTDQAHLTDVYELIPGAFQTLEMVAEVNGTWLLHCHVANHIRAGMETTFIVKPRSGGGTVRRDLSIFSLLITFTLRLI